MRAVAQRVRRASVAWTEPSGEECRQSIDHGLVILLGAGPEDHPEDAARLADKIAQLRIFPDAEGRFNRSLEDVAGAALVVSQFTLYADTTRGRRPGFSGAAAPDQARALCDHFAAQLRQRGLTTKTGSFGAHMLVSLDNEGPVTIVLSTEPWETRISG